MEPTAPTQDTFTLPQLQQPTESYTEQEIALKVLGAFDCVALIVKLQNEQNLTQKQQDTITRNVQHLQIMLSKAWFTQALTSQQLADIQAVI